MRRILVIRGGAIGDFIFTLPVFEALKTRDPAVRGGYPRLRRDRRAGGRAASCGESPARGRGGVGRALFAGRPTRRSGATLPLRLRRDVLHLAGRRRRHRREPPPRRLAQRRLRGPDAGRRQGRPRRGPYREAMRKGGPRDSPPRAAPLSVRARPHLGRALHARHRRRRPAAARAESRQRLAGQELAGGTLCGRSPATG